MFRIVNAIALVVYHVNKLAPYVHPNSNCTGEFDSLGKESYCHVDVLGKGRNIHLSIWQGNVNLSIWGWGKDGFDKVMDALQNPSNGIVKLVSGKCGEYDLGEVTITVDEDKLDRAYMRIDTNKILDSVHRCNQEAIYRQWGEPMSA